MSDGSASCCRARPISRAGAAGARGCWRRACRRSRWSGASSATRPTCSAATPAAGRGRAGAPPACRAPSSSWRRSPSATATRERFALLYRILWRLVRASTGCCRWRPTPTSSGCRPGESGAAGRAQDARLRPLPRGRRPTTARALRRLVRARPPHRARPRPRFFIRRFAAHALVHPDAGGAARIGTARRCASAPAASRAEAPPEDAHRGTLARLLPQHLQPGAAEARTRCGPRCR